MVVLPLLLLPLPVSEPEYDEVGAAPLVHELATNRMPDDQIVANYGTVFSLAVYGPWMDGLETGIEDVRGFLPTWSDHRIVGLVRSETPDDFKATLMDVLDADRVWLLFDPRTQAWTPDIIADVMNSRGYELVSSSRNGDVRLEFWIHTHPIMARHSGSLVSEESVEQSVVGAWTEGNLSGFRRYRRRVPWDVR